MKIWQTHHTNCHQIYHQTYQRAVCIEQIFRQISQSLKFQKRWCPSFELNSNQFASSTINITNSVLRNPEERTRTQSPVCYSQRVKHVNEELSVDSPSVTSSKGMRPQRFSDLMCPRRMTVRAALDLMFHLWMPSKANHQSPDYVMERNQYWC